jgi:HPt (histidine-containing phosphotransfer) domain-containing protein
MTNAPAEDEVEIDFDHLNRFVQGDVPLTKELFSLFRNQVEMWSRVLDARADDETWVSAVHSLKGSANAVGAVALAQRCERAETLVADKKTSGARDMAVQDIEFRISRAVAEIQRWEYRQTLNDMRS